MGPHVSVNNPTDLQKPDNPYDVPDQPNFYMRVIHKIKWTQRYLQVFF